MVKIVFILSFMSLWVCAEELDVQEQSVEQNCLHCHKQQQIPSNLIYKRYLMKYSTDKRMEEAIFAYLKHPDKAHSIMPSAFFSRFPMKKSTTVDDSRLHKYIESYLEQFDVRKKLRLEK
ncbi:hypothetical protein MNB_SV-8-839 [hydrothermal vent metagenome]|uniref:Cytochrome c domain-containing protein n=1 Tax=hydrothermal vent metagenome TaxID=652676 RepID=A0A1W1C0U9_9ZZZZ